MTIQYLFNSSGEWIAYRKDNYIFDKKYDWIGWMPWDDNEVVCNVSGDYIGTISEDGRFYYLENRKYHGIPGHPGDPGYLSYPGEPEPLEKQELPAGSHDVLLPSSTLDNL